MYWAVLSYFYTYNIFFLFSENLADNDEEFKHKSIAFMSRSEQYSLSVKKAVALVKRIKELDLTDNRDVYWFRQYVLRQYSFYNFRLRVWNLHFRLGARKGLLVKKIRGQKQDFWLL